MVKGTFLQRLTFKGRSIIGCAICFLFFNLFKDCYQERQVQIAENEKKEGDSIGRVNTINAVIAADSAQTRSIVKALAEYNLTAKRQSDSILNIIKDSVKKITYNTSPQPNPHLGLCIPNQGEEYKSLRMGKSRNGMDTLLFDLCSVNDCFRSKVYVFVMYTINKDTLSLSSLVLNDQDMMNGVVKPSYRYLDKRMTGNEFFVRILGYTYNSDGKKFSIDELFTYYISNDIYLDYGAKRKLFDNYLIRNNDIVKYFFKHGKFK